MLLDKHIWLSDTDKKYYIGIGNGISFNTETEALEHRKTIIKNESLQLVENIKIMEKLVPYYILKEDDVYIYNSGKFETYEEAIMHQYYINNGNKEYRQITICKNNANEIEVFIEDLLLGITETLAVWNNDNIEFSYCYDYYKDFNNLKEWEETIEDLLGTKVEWRELATNKDIIVKNETLKYTWAENEIIEWFSEDEEGKLYFIAYEPCEEHKHIFDEMFQNHLNAM